MKVKVINKFIDKYTGEVHKVGDILDIKKDRLEEICQTDKVLVEVVVAENTTPTEKKKTAKKAAKKETE